MVRRSRFLTHLMVAGALAAGLPLGAIAGGGRGGDSGDSSMNPFTGDSYAYFNGGHNLGEQAMIVPGRNLPTRPGQARTDKAGEATANVAPRSASRPERPDEHRSDAQRSGAVSRAE